MTAAPSASRVEIAFVFDNLHNWQQLAAAARNEGREVAVLSGAQDGLAQMEAYLQGRIGVDAIHVLSHGAQGTVQTGNIWLSSANLANHRTALESIGASLTIGGDLMLYGCDVGQGDKGQAFIDQLAAITGADVAASADDTGSAALGGNWTLERSVGSIKTTALGAQLEGYTAVMAAQFTGGADANAPVLGTGALSRMVVGDFNGDGRDDILFQTSNTVNAPWKFAAGKFGGGFTIVDSTDITSPFRNIDSMVDMANTGSNYYAADFDNDGDIDLLGVTVTLGPAYLYRNNNGVFESTTPTGFGGAQFGSRLVVGDFNGDGAADILYQPGTVDNLNSWRYALNNGNGTFTDVAQSASPFASFSLPTYSNFNYRVIDFEGDGDLDIIYMVAANPASLFLNNGNGTFALGAGGNIPIATFSQRAIFGDFDGDGDADMFWQIGTNDTDWNYAENLSNGTFAPTVTRANSPFKGLQMVDFGTTNFRIGDFDGDGDTDLLGSSAGVGASVYYQDGTSPKLLSTTPADESGAVSPSANIVLKFDQTVLKGSGNIKIVRTSDNQVIQTIDVTSGAVTGSGDTWTINPPADLVGGVAYAMRIDSKAFVSTSSKIYAGIQTNTELNFVTSNIASPVISGLDGDSISYTEKGAPVLIDPTGNAVVTDADSLNFSGGTLTVTINSGRVNSEDVLGVMHEGTGAGQIGVSGGLISYNNITVGIASGGTGSNPLVINFNSLATPTVLSALLHRLTYSNSNTTDIGTGARNIQVTLADGTGGVSNVANISLAITAVNDAPVVNITATNPTYTENTSAVQLFSGATINTVESGQLVKQMIFTVSGIANGAAEKLVIDGTDVTLVQGTALTTSINGISVSVSVSSGTATVTLDKAAGLSTATAQTILNNMSYRNDSETPTTVNRVVTLSTVSDNGGSTDGGQPTAAVGIFSTVTVVGINDAPVISDGPYNFATTNEDTTATGVRISTILANHTMIDPDTGALRGVAIVTKSGHGTWQYSTDNANWTDFGAVSSTSALLLASTAYVRYVPDGANGETASLTFRGWDQTTGTASSNGIRGLADTTSNGGTTAFSIGTGAVNQIVTSVNDAPVIIGVAPTLGGLTDGSINNGGALVSDLLGGATDVDTGALKGMAITGLTATYGKWQYSTNAGGTWSDIGSVSVTSALILTAQNMVRFVPDGIQGETATITYKAWDQTNATLGLQGTKTNTSTSGGTSAYSSQFDTATVVVTAVNDRPVVTPTGTTAVWTEANNAPSDRIVVDSGVTMSDPDGPNPLNATVRLLTYYSSQDSLAFVNDGLSMGNIVGTWSAGTGILTLTSAGNTATAAEFQAAMRAVTYGNSSDTPNTTSRTIQFQVTDGGGLASIAVTRDVTIVAVNDSPTISAPTSQAINEDIAMALGSITFSDVDSTLGIVTFSVGTGTLSATSAGGVTVGGTSTALTLSGTLANINQFIANNRLVYTPAANASGDVTLTINVNTTSASDATTTLTLQVAAVNDAPVISAPTSITVTEDVSSVISGFSFTDVDAGTNTVTATFSVPSGTLSAPTGMGVTVGGSGSGLLTLTGSLADINFFIAANGLTFQTAQDATASVILTVNINDGSFSGSGGEQIDTKTVTLNVTAVNDAPVNSVPGSQTIGQDNPLVFNSAKGNLISVSDIDVGSGTVEVTLSAANGLLTLSTTTGLNFTSGDGSADATMTFSGTLSAVNDALNGLIFTPATGYSGPATITLTTNDSGGTGSGGALSDTDVIAITVSPPPEPEPVKPTEPTKPAVPVDGALVSTQTAADGSTITTITPVTADRTDDPNTPNADLADIPLIIAPNGQPIVQVGLPVGVGLQSQGQAHALNGGAALTELALRIQAVNGNAQLLSNGQSFMEGVDASTPLHVQTITVSTGTGFNPAVPLVISGSRLPQEGKQAIVLDARALPSGSVIQVDHIDFIAVVGNVRLIGGSGQNMAAGDDGAQWIVLGADDDVLHGGGGNDTVGSLGGNDQVFGDAGDDIVFGGTGHDTLSGGTGNDKLHGGLGWDTAKQSGAQTDYYITNEGSTLVLTHTKTGEVDRFASVELLQFEGGPNLYVVSSDAQAALVHIVTTWLGRELRAEDGLMLQGWVQYSPIEVAESILAGADGITLTGQTAAQLLEGWQNNARYVRVEALSEYVPTSGFIDSSTFAELNAPSLRFEMGGDGSWEGIDLATGSMISLQATTSNAYSETYYLASKLAQLREVDPQDARWQQSDGISTATLREAIAAVGLTPQQHFEQYGLQEKTSLNPWFDANQYLANKVQQLNDAKEQGRIDWTAQQVANAVEAAGMSLWTHYQAFGWREGISPSKQFDNQQYFSDKLAQLQREFAQENWTESAMKDAFQAAQLDPISHYLLYGQREGLEITTVGVPELSS